MTLPIKKLVIAISLFAGSIVLGMIGFMQIEDFSITDAFYMAVITLGSVGFTEVHELSKAGRMFTSFYIIMNLGIYAYVIAVLGQYFFEGELGNIFKKLKTQNKIDKMSDHVIICGFGRNGSKAAEEILKSGKSVVVIEIDASQLKEHNNGNSKGITFLEGDATRDEILLSAGIERSSAIITTLGDDAQNVFITLTARELKPNIKIISRASSTQSEKKLIRAGADHVVMPEFIGGFHMASLITQPEVIPITNLIETYLSDELRVEEITSEDLHEKFKNKTLKDLGLYKNKEIMVLGYRKLNGDFAFNPDENLKLQTKEYLILLGTNKSLDNFRRLFMH